MKRNKATDAPEFNVMVAVARASHVRALQRRIEKQAWKAVEDGRRKGDAVGNYVAALDRVLELNPREFDLHVLDMMTHFVPVLVSSHAGVLDFVRLEARVGNPFVQEREDSVRERSDRILLFVKEVEGEAARRTQRDGVVDLEVAGPSVNVRGPCVGSFRGSGAPTLDDAEFFEYE